MENKQKVLICDDEEMICELILRLADWDGLGMTVIGTAHDGLTAFSLIKSQAPDIVITDIRMPDMDGLQLIKAAHDFGCPARFVVISGHRQFDYAYEALKYGAVDYLLKPIKKQELMHTLRKLAAPGPQSVEASAAPARQDAHLRRQFIANIIGKMLPQDITPEGVNAHYGYRFRPALFQMIAVKLDARPGMDPQVAAAQMPAGMELLQDNLLAMLRGHCYEVEVYQQGDTLYCILNFAEGERPAVQRMLRRIYYDVAACTVAISEFFDVTVCASRIVNGIAKLPIASHDITLAVNSRVVLGVGQVIEAAHLPENTPNPQQAFSFEDWQQFDHYIEMLDADGLARWMDDRYERVTSLSQAYPFLFIETAEYLANLFYLMMERNGHLQGGEDPQNLTAEIIHRYASAQEIWQQLKTFFAGFIAGRLEQRQDMENQPIRLAQKYILEHLGESLTLERVAAQIYISPVYLSSIFKKYAGESFVDYIAKCRIDRAKSLLKDIHLTVGDIARQVGYTDTRYFTKLFKKHVGITPQAYRRLYS